jgi:Domain of unknown function (DUF5076)
MAMKSIGIPPAALEDDTSVEMARVWVAKRGLHCVLNVGTYRGSDIREATAWGVMLADMSRHVSDALHASGIEASSADALTEIRDMMMRELDSPTSDASGEFKRTNQ